MREVTQNKASTSSATKYLCPSCGQTARHGCRDTLNGPYCVQHGLRFDQARLLHTSPNPVADAVKADPEAQSAALAESEAQAAFDKVSGQWETALGGLASLRLKASRDRGEFTNERGWRPSSQLRKLRKEEQALAAEAETLGEQRDLAARVLGRAREAHRLALDDARLRAGGTVWFRQQPGGTSQLVIPSY